ncbi:MAG: methyl-accepting chemotaxis protein, partial [Cellulomonas sp.]|nr:methyl-accepting chemotaxis protein [Cellulomonas sp.]
AIGQIAVIVAQINDYQTTIAAAVEEQTATTAEMGRGIGEAANGSGRIASATHDLATAAAGTSGVVQRMDEAVVQLAARAAVLAERAGRFAV